MENVLMHQHPKITAKSFHNCRHKAFLLIGVTCISASFVWLVLIYIPISVITALFLFLGGIISIGFYTKQRIQFGGLQALLPFWLNRLLQQESILEIFFRIVKSGRLTFYASRIIMLLITDPNNEEDLAAVFDGWEPGMMRIMSTRGFINLLPNSVQKVYNPILTDISLNTSTAAAVESIREDDLQANELQIDDRSNMGINDTRESYQATTTFGNIDAGILSHTASIADDVHSALSPNLNVASEYNIFSPSSQIQTNPQNIVTYTPEREIFDKNGDSPLFSRSSAPQVFHHGSFSPSSDTLNFTEKELGIASGEDSLSLVPSARELASRLRAGASTAPNFPPLSQAIARFAARKISQSETSIRARRRFRLVMSLLLAMYFTFKVSRRNSPTVRKFWTRVHASVGGARGFVALSTALILIWPLIRAAKEGSQSDLFGGSPSNTRSTTSATTTQLNAIDNGFGKIKKMIEIKTAEENAKLRKQQHKNREIAAHASLLPSSQQVGLERRSLLNFADSASSEEEVESEDDSDLKSRISLAWRKSLWSGFYWLLGFDGSTRNSLVNASAGISSNHKSGHSLILSLDDTPPPQENQTTEKVKSSPFNENKIICDNNEHMKILVASSSSSSQTTGSPADPVRPVSSSNMMRRSVVNLNNKSDYKNKQEEDLDSPFAALLVEATFHTTDIPGFENWSGILRKDEVSMAAAEVRRQQRRKLFTYSPAPQSPFHGLEDKEKKEKQIPKTVFFRKNTQSASHHKAIQDCNGRPYYAEFQENHNFQYPQQTCRKHLQVKAIK